MKIKTIYTIILLLATLNISSCGSTSPSKTPTTIEGAEKLLAKKRKKQAKEAKKAKKAAEKRYWRAQSKSARKSVKKNKRRQKRITKHKKKNH